MADWTDLASWTLAIVLYDGAAGAVESRGWWGKPTVGVCAVEIELGMAVGAQETSAILSKAKVRDLRGFGVRRCVVLFSVFMTRHASVMSLMSGSPCRSSVCCRHCITVAARAESISLGRGSRPAVGVLPYWARHLSLRCPSPMRSIKDSKVSCICLRSRSCLSLWTTQRYLPRVAVSLVVSIEQSPCSRRLWCRHQFSSISV